MKISISRLACAAASALGMALLPAVGCATMATRCESVPVTVSLQNENGQHRLQFTVENPTEHSISFYKFYFEENLLKLRASVKATGEKLSNSIPLLTPGVENIVIRAGDEYSTGLILEDVFPDLRKTLGGSDVLVSFELQVKPVDYCLTQTVSTTIVVSKAK